MAQLLVRANHFCVITHIYFLLSKINVAALTHWNNLFKGKGTDKLNLYSCDKIRNDSSKLLRAVIGEDVLEGEKCCLKPLCSIRLNNNDKLSFITPVCCRKRNGCVSTVRPSGSCPAADSTTRRCQSLIRHLNTSRRARPVTRRRPVNRAPSTKRPLNRAPRPRRLRPRSHLPVQEVRLRLPPQSYQRTANCQQTPRLRSQLQYRLQPRRPRNSNPKPLRRSPRLSLRHPKRPNHLRRKENPSHQLRTLRSPGTMM